ncbi:hypothetical protein LRS56_11460 [Pseudomonas poae]|nr:hypothetical protein LRS56_11460 [Pseudomonas poae]
MSLGPSQLKPLHDDIIKKYSGEIARFAAGEVDWKHAVFDDLKKSLRVSLRLQQDGRCVYCRRKIKIERRNAAEDIEHFLDKSKDKYKKWAFTAVNLALACHPCNMQKSTRDMGDAVVSRASELTAASGEYSWIHPYFDDYFDNIEIMDAWLYVIKKGAPRPNRARAMIVDCQLDQIKTIEADRVALLDKVARLQDLASRCLERENKSNKDRALKLLETIGNYAKNGWKFV